ncbi:MAG: ribosomal protein S18-alanine N-acetyltransferase [Actinomycetota bacterium]|nr:ribosomal protein S18-alanine N-acetyltransferase [Actinomycetota bacterium]
MVEPGDDPAQVPGSPAMGPDEVIAPLPTENTEVTVHLAPLRRRHLRSVLRIEAQVYPRPWSLPLFMSELNLRTNRAYVAARVEGVVVGYAGIMLAGEEAHITTIAVDPAWQRHKIGSRMLAHLVRATVGHGARHLTLEVRMSNAGAQAMYRRFGFEPAGVRRNYYAETNEDALVMWAHDLDNRSALARLAAIEAAIPGATVDDTLTLDDTGPAVPGTSEERP